jgi:hypothetical protein
MTHSAPSALVTNDGKVLFRLKGRFFEVRQEEFRTLLGLPSGPLGVGIVVDGNNFRFEFPLDKQRKRVSADELLRLLDKQAIS